MADLIVAGAGMGGLCRRRRRPRSWGARVELREKGDRAGGNMLLSSGVIWRHRDFERFRAECPAGDPALQRTVFDRLDADLAWLESLGARPLARDTGNPLTAGARFDTRQLTDALVSAAGADGPTSASRCTEASRRRAGGAGDRRLPGRPGPGARARDSARRGELMLRADPVERGRRNAHRARRRAAARRPAWASSTGATCPRRPRAWGRRTSCGSRSSTRRTQRCATRAVSSTRATTWSEIDVVQWTARQPRRACLVRGRRR